MSRDSGASYQALDTDSDPGSFGIALTVLPAFTTTGAWDDTNHVDVQLTQGTDAPPTTLSDADVLSGKGGVIVGDEYIQAGTVVSLGNNQYRLSHLLRGRRGTDFFWGKHLAGERVVLDNGGIKRFTLPNDLLGATILLKAVGSGQQPADILTPITVHIYGRETREFAPITLAATRNGGGDITFTWTRRARKNFDLQNNQDVPLDTTTERYSLYALSSAATSIAGITNATQAVVNVPGHNFSVGQWSYFESIAGMIELNGEIAQAVSIDTVNPNLVTFDIDTSLWGVYAAPPGNSWRARRVIAATAPTCQYLSVDQVGDFGSNQNPIQVVVAELGNDSRNGYTLAGFV